MWRIPVYCSDWPNRRLRGSGYAGGGPVMPGRVGCVAGREKHFPKAARGIARTQVQIFVVTGPAACADNLE